MGSSQADSLNRPRGGHAEGAGGRQILYQFRAGTNRTGVHDRGSGLIRPAMATRALNGGPGFGGRMVARTGNERSLGDGQDGLLWDEFCRISACGAIERFVNGGQLAPYKQ